MGWAIKLLRAYYRPDCEPLTCECPVIPNKALVARGAAYDWRFYKASLTFIVRFVLMTSRLQWCVWYVLAEGTRHVLHRLIFNYSKYNRSIIYWYFWFIIKLIEIHLKWEQTAKTETRRQIAHYRNIKWPHSHLWFRSRSCQIRTEISMDICNNKSSIYFDISIHKINRSWSS